MAKISAGLHADRLTDPKNYEELRFVRAWKKLKRLNAIVSWLMGDGTKRVAVSHRDYVVADTIIQWLGTETGVDFLRSLGYVKTEALKPKKEGSALAAAREAGKANIARQIDEANHAFAKDLCERLNTLLGYYHEDVRADIRTLLDERVHVGDGTVDHPSIQCTNNNTLGVLGLLNGIIYPDCPDHGKFTKIALQVKADGTYEFVTIEDK